MKGGFGRLEGKMICRSKGGLDGYRCRCFERLILDYCLKGVTHGWVISRIWQVVSRIVLEAYGLTYLQY